MQDFPEILHFTYAGTTAYLVPAEPVKKGSNKKVIADVREYEWQYEYCKPECEGRCQGCNKSGLRFSISLRDIKQKIDCKLVIAE